MKFKQLNIGQQFEYQEQTYIKTTPLIAKHSETGEQKLIPRYAELGMLGDIKVSEDKRSPNLTVEFVAQAISLHKEELKKVVDAIKYNMDSNISTQLLDIIEKAYHSLYENIGINRN